MGFMDPKPVTTAALDAAVRDKINLVGSATQVALAATYGPAAQAASAPLKAAFAGLGLFENFTPANFRRFRAALARSRAGGAVARISFYGDSNTSGYQGPNSNDYTRGYAARAQGILDGKLGSVKNGLIFTRIGGANPKPDPRFVLGTGWSEFASTSQGMAGAGAIQGTANGTTGNLDITLAGVNAFTIWYPVYGSGPTALAFNIDAEAATVVSANNATASMGKTTITTATVGTHTLHIKSNTGGVPYIHAIEGFDNTLAGATRVTASGLNGGTAVDWNLAPSPTDPWDPSKVVFNPNIDAPDLTIINLSINAHNAGTPIGTYTAAMNTFIAKAKATSDVILVASAAGGAPDYSGLGWGAYLTAQRDIAATNGCGLINMQDRWGPYATANAAPYLLWNDQDHPSNAGYWDMGQASADAILLAAGRTA